MKIITESYSCPLTGDNPDPRWQFRYHYVPSPNAILIPGKWLPPETTDAQAEHERAMMPGSPSWERWNDGRVVIWVEM